MTTLQELLAQKAALERAIVEAQSANRAEAVARIRTLMQENGLVAADLGQTSKVDKKATGVKKPVAAKYRDAHGNQWSGRGLKPKWISAALAAGKTLQDLAI